MQKDHSFTIHVTGRHVDITPALKEYAQKKVEHLAPDYPRIQSAHIILTIEKYRQKAEFVLHCNNHIVIEAHETTDDMYASIDLAIDKVLQQMRKHKTKLLKSHRPRKYAPTEINVQVYRADFQSISVEEDHLKPREIHTEKVVIRPLSLDDAILEMSINEKQFLVFFNNDTELVNIIYRRSDGDFAVIVPTKK